MRSEPEIKKIVEKAKSRNLEALSQIYEEYCDRIYRYALVRTKNSADAEDITSQTFLKVLEAIEGFTWQGAGFSAWLFQIAHNLVMDHFRRNRRFAGISETNKAELLSPVELEDMILRDDSLREIMKAVEELGEEQKQVILLRFVAGLSGVEIAQILQKSTENVRTLQHRALKKIKEKLQVGTFHGA